MTTIVETTASQTSIANSSQMPDKPRLTLRIGIVGHRKLASSVQNEADYISSLTNVLAEIENSLMGLRQHDDLAGIFDDASQPQIRIVTGVAHGTDRWAQTATQSFRGIKRSTPKTDKVDWKLELISPAPIGVAAAWAYEDAVDACCESYAKAWHDMLGKADIVTCLEARWRCLLSTSETPVQRPKLPSGFTCENAFASYCAPPVGANALSYSHAADFQLRQCDMIIVVWDGQGSRGPGGTADIAAKAVRLGMPAILIDWNAPKSTAHFIERIETAETLPPIDGWLELTGKPTAETPEVTARIEAVLIDLFKPPVAIHSEVGHREAHKNEAINLPTYFKEVADPRIPSAAYARMVDLFSKGPSIWLDRVKRRLMNKETLSEIIKFWQRPLKSAHWAKRDWSDFVTGLPKEGQQGERLLSTLWNRFEQADLLAVDYAARYRSVFVRSYLLSALAVLIALVGLAAGDTLPSITKVLLVAVELVVLFCIFKMVEDGRKRQYHAKLVEYRALAEGLRHQAWLATFGEFPLSSPSQSTGSWVNWYLRATGRELGPPQGTLDASFQSSLISAALVFEITQQLHYHEDNRKKMHAVDDGLHGIGELLFGTTGFMLFGYLVLYGLKSLHPASVLGDDFEKGLEHFLHAAKPWIGLLAAFMPTLGSALAGIRFTGDFEGKAAQSEVMANALRAFQTRAETLQRRCDWSTTREFLLDLEALLSEDVAQFHSNYGRQPLALPA